MSLTRDGRTGRYDCNVRSISMRSSENNVPDCCDTTVEDTSSMEDGEGISGVLLSNARVALTTTDDKWSRGKLLGEIADDDNSKEDTEGNTAVPCSKVQLELIATGEYSLLDGRLKRTSDFDSTSTDDTSLDDTNGSAGVLTRSFAIPELSATNEELLMAKVLERKTFEDGIETEDSEGTAAVFGPATIDPIAIYRTLLALLPELSDDNTAADDINTQVHVAVFKYNRHNNSNNNNNNNNNALTARISDSANSYLKLSLFKKLLLNRYKSGLNFKFYSPWF